LEELKADIPIRTSPISVSVRVRFRVRVGLIRNTDKNWVRVSIPVRTFPFRGSKDACTVSGLSENMSFREAMDVE